MSCGGDFNSYPDARSVNTCLTNSRPLARMMIALNTGFILTFACFEDVIKSFSSSSCISSVRSFLFLKDNNWPDYTFKLIKSNSDV